MSRSFLKNASSFYWQFQLCVACRRVKVEEEEEDGEMGVFSKT